jgi:AraC family transcriptional regulator of adaptative response / DNA-3-methyladenine glycosylase II
VIGPLAARCPGRRAVGAVDGHELAIRAVLGQQVSVAAARRLAARLVALCGTALRGTALGGTGQDGTALGGTPDGELTHLFPDAATIAGLDPAVLPMPLARARAVVTLAAALASGDVGLDPGADREEAAARLLALPGIGPWTAGYIRMRALSDPDVFLPGDAGAVRALAQLTGDAPGSAGSGSPGSRSPGPSTLAAAESWRPWRSYATHHLWATLEQPPLRPAGELLAVPAGR